MKLFWGFITKLLVGRKNKFKNKFKKTKVKDLNNELLELQVEQDVLLNQIKRWGDRYNSWHKSVLYKESTDGLVFKPIRCCIDFARAKSPIGHTSARSNENIK